MTQRPDQATAKDSGGSFEAHPEGQYAAVCADVVNFGIRVEDFPGSEPREVAKAALVFVSGQRQENGELTIVTVEMTLSMHEKANMRRFLESWRGKSYSAQQAEAGVPLHKLQGQAALMSIEQITTKRGRLFAKVSSISPLPKDMEPPEPGLLEEYTRPTFLEERKAEYAAALAKHRGSQAGEQPAWRSEEADELDEVPF